MDRLRVVDSHTGGEPTRVVVEGLPSLDGETAADKLAELRGKHDRFRTAVIGEPRSPSFSVGAYLFRNTQHATPNSFQIVFFNNFGYLGMCGHGTIGVVATLAYLGLVEPGVVRLETPVGVVSAILHEDGRVSFENVPSYRHGSGVVVELPDPPVTRGGSQHLAFNPKPSGDIAYGGNWFFICSDLGLDLEKGEIRKLRLFTMIVKDQLRKSGITGSGGAEIDHIELVGPSKAADAKNFVLCPGGEYDRSPCGTGTSAKLACLLEDGKLAEGQIWRQESITGSVFEGSARRTEAGIIPTITGRAFINGETTILIDPDDPFAWGLR